MTTQDIEKLKAFCEKEGLYFDFDEIDGTALIVRDKEPVRAKIKCFTLSNPDSTIIFTIDQEVSGIDAKEFMNHIEESIESYLNAKSPSKNN